MYDDGDEPYTGADSGDDDAPFGQRETRRISKRRRDIESIEIKSSPAGAAAGARFDNSLGILTQRFVDLLKRAPDGVLDLNIASDKLGVQKRRIYDITNVLEGIGLIVKKSKNNIQWRGNESATDGAQRQATDLRHAIEALHRREAELDGQLRHLQENLRGIAEDSAGVQYVTHEDIRSLPSLRGKTLIAVKAPISTTLEVPDPDEGMLAGRRRFQIMLRSSGGPIDVYLLSRTEGAPEAVVQDARADGGAAAGDAAAAAAGAADSDAMVTDEPTSDALGAVDEVVKVLPPGSPDMMFYEGQGIADLYPDEALPEADYAFS